VEDASSGVGGQGRLRDRRTQERAPGENKKRSRYVGGAQKRAEPSPPVHVRYRGHDSDAASTGRVREQQIAQHGPAAWPHSPQQVNVGRGQRHEGNAAVGCGGHAGLRAPFETLEGFEKRRAGRRHVSPDKHGVTSEGCCLPGGVLEADTQAAASLEDPDGLARSIQGPLPGGPVLGGSRNHEPSAGESSRVRPSAGKPEEEIPGRSGRKSLVARLARRLPREQNQVAIHLVDFMMPAGPSGFTKGNVQAATPPENRKAGAFAPAV